jgi:hypothetical protein
MVRGRSLRCYSGEAQYLKCYNRTVPVRLRRGHGADGKHRGAHREPGPGQGQLLQGKLMMMRPQVRIKHSFGGLVHPYSPIRLHHMIREAYTAQY